MAYPIPIKTNTGYLFPPPLLSKGLYIPSITPRGSISQISSPGKQTSPIGDWSQLSWASPRVSPFAPPPPFEGTKERHALQTTNANGTSILFSSSNLLLRSFTCFEKKYIYTFCTVLSEFLLSLSTHYIKKIPQKFNIFLCFQV